jgi:hypothetical protein
MHWHGYRLAGVQDNGWCGEQHRCRRKVGSHLLSSSKSETVEGIKVELQLAPMPLSPGSPLNALWGLGW